MFTLSQVRYFPRHRCFANELLRQPWMSHPQNPDPSKFCLSCGSKLLLRERYHPLQPLGQGGFGRTFLAVDEDIPSKPRCVIKQFHFVEQNPENLDKATQLFRQEAVRLEELGRHSQIPTLLAHFEQEQRLYLVQEFIEGQTLQQELEQGVFKESQIWELLQDLLGVLQFIHERRVIHRDIKPENIIRRASDRKPVLIDFGIAKLLTDTAFLRPSTRIGTQYYAAPEVVLGKALPASDLYSLGVTCIYLLTRVPLVEMYDAREWRWREHLPEGKAISEHLSQILDQLLQASVQKRYQSANQVLTALTATVQAPTEFVPSPGDASAPTAALEPSPISATSSNLRATVGVDYTTLQRLLESEQWQNADRETRALLCQLLNKPLDTSLLPLK